MKHIIAGIDEAGRGALAGPVVAAACVVPESFPDEIVITDSKKIAPETRETSYEWITKYCAYGTGMQSAKDIDNVGILEATNTAMNEALKELQQSVQPTFLLVDGRDKFWFDVPHTSIIRGDESELCIAAASIIAKVTRDRYMCELNDDSYGFAQHKGYGTQMHFTLIEKHGISDMHRQTFLTKNQDRLRAATTT